MLKLLVALTLVAGASVPLVSASAHEGQKMEFTHAHSRHAVFDHAFHRQSKRLSVPAHAAFRYRKGGRCHHYHYYKPVVPDCR